MTVAPKKCEGKELGFLAGSDCMDASILHARPARTIPTFAGSTSVPPQKKAGMRQGREWLVDGLIVIDRGSYPPTALAAGHTN